MEIMAWLPKETPKVSEEPDDSGNVIDKTK